MAQVSPAQEPVTASPLPGGGATGVAGAEPLPASVTLPISGYVICQDEEAVIARCLEGLSFCQDIVVVDSGSTDRTIEIVQRLAKQGLPIRLFHQAWLGYARQKQFALQQASCPWCLNMDADEEIDAALASQLPVLLEAPAEVAGWRLRRSASRRTGTGPFRVYAKPILRLVRRDRARYDERALVHEGFLLDGAVRDARIGLIRHQRDLTVAEQLDKLMRYARLRATERVQRGRRPSVLKLVLNPPFAFLRTYLLHRWYLEGRGGFVHAVTSAVYAFCAEAFHFELDGQSRGGTRLSCGSGSDTGQDRP